MRDRIGPEAFRAASVAANSRHRARMGEEVWSAKERARSLDYNRRNPEKRRTSAKIIMSRLYKQDPQRLIDRTAANERRLLEENPEMLRLSQAARRAAYNVRKVGTVSERGLTAIVRRVWAACDGKCTACGSRDRLELDHKLAIANGGDNAETNLQFLCRPCNRSKGTNDFQAWLSGREELQSEAA